MLIICKEYPVDDGRVTWEAVSGYAIEIVGRGATEDEAVEDWLAQANEKYPLH